MALAERTVAHMFEEQVARTPHQMAVIDGRRSLTYFQLNGLVNRWARLLRRSGVEPETLVGVLMDRSIETLIACLSVAKAGGAYVPLPPEHPRERLQSILRDCAPTVVLTEAAYAELGRSLGQGNNLLELDGSAISCESDDNLSLHCTASSLAYVLYTSGSTGHPKGVEIEHRALANYLDWAGREYDLAVGSVVPLFSPLSFDFTVTSLLLPLTVGGCVHLVDDYRTLFGTESDQKYSLVKLTPAHLGMVHSLGAPDRLAQLTSLLVLGGDALLAESLGPWRAAAELPTMVNEYGPTEATVGCCSYRFDARDSGDAAVPIGQPISNATIYLLDEDLQPVPTGQIGEIYVGGRCLGRGYLNQPSLTAQRFVPDLFGPEAGARLYRTGDAARRLPGGDLEFCGRLDSQVKVLGYRVELGEVESCILRHPDVAEAVVLSELDSGGDRRLVAYLVGEADRPVPQGSDLRVELRRLLPDYMLPLSFVTLPSLPLTPHGKVDRKALASWSKRLEEQEPTATAANAADASAIAKIFADVLNVPDVGGDDNFFELGGESLAAVRVAARVQAELGAGVSIGTVFASPTPRGLSRVIAQAQQPQISVPLRAVGGKGPFPLSFAQRRLWFLAQMQPDSPEYNVPLALRLRGPLRIAEMQSAFEQLVEDHRVLRTVFPATDGQPVQLVTDWQCPLKYIGAPETGDAVRWLEDYASEEVRRPFDLARDLPIRANLVRLNRDDHVLLIVIHHIGFDVRSREILCGDLARRYSTLCAGASTNPRERNSKIEYTDYAIWERQVADEPKTIQQLAYWRSQLRDTRNLDLAPGRHRSRPRSYQGATFSAQLDESLVASIHDLAQRLNLTANIVLLSAYKLLLSRLSGQGDVVVGSPAVGRAVPDLDDVVGCFLNMLPLRTDVSGRLSYVDLVRRVARTMTGAIDNSNIPFELLIDHLRVARDTSRPPLFQVAFSYKQVDESVMAEFHQLDVGSFAIQQHTTKVDLGLAVTCAGRTTCIWEFGEELFELEFVEQMHQYFEAILRAAVAAPEEDVGRIWSSAISEGGASLVGPIRELPDCGAHELFERQVEIAPAQVAAVCAGQSLTYREMDDRADELAQQLLSHGVEPGVLVGLHLERGLELIVAILAIWKAGGAYVPLDPAYPEDRLIQAVRASGASVILTQRSLSVGLVAEVVLYLDDREASSPASIRYDRPAVHGGDLAYVIFTSGSTGNPKGVEITHRSVVNLISSFVATLGLSSSDSLVAVTTFSFDISVLEILLPLACGTRLVIAESADMNDPARLCELVERYSATVMQATPSTWRMLADLSGIPDRLATRLCGGEQLQRELAEVLAADGVSVWNLYGPTETTVWSSANVVSVRSTQPPVGTPIANTQIYLLDEAWAIVPAGVIGEVYIGGEGVARGYLGSSALTAKNFVPDPFTSTPGRRMYRTGDLGRLRADRTIEFLGRLDHQVKIRGHRVELGEVERILRSSPDVRQAVVAGRSRGRSYQSLVAYLVPKRGQEAIDMGRIHALIRQKLPEYMRPNAFVVLSALPLMPNGKLDRAALPLPDRRLEVTSDYVPARSRAEEVLTSIWEDLLGLDSIGVYDNFFELGGDSILAVRVVSRARNEGLWLTPAQVIDLATVSELAAAIPPRPPKLVPRGPVTGEIGHLPGTEPWLGQSAGFETLVIELDDGISESEVRAVLMHLLGHHDVLRAVWKRMDGREALVIEDQFSSPSFDVVDAGSHSPERALHMDGEWSPSSDAVLHAIFVRSLSEPNSLVLALHRAIVDRQSWILLIEDFRACCEASRRGAALSLGEKTTSLVQWSERLDEYATSGVSRSDYGYWLSAGEPRRTGPLALGGATSAHESLSDSVTSGLLYGEAESWYGTPPRELLITALMLALTEVFGTSEVWINIEGDPRATPFPEIDLSRTVGKLGCRFPVLLSRSRSDDLAVSVKGVRDELRAVPKQGLPHGVIQLLQSSQTSRGEPAQTRLGCTFFTFREELGLAGVREVPTENGVAEEHSGLSVVCASAGRQLHIEVMDRQGGFHNEVVERVCHLMTARVEELVRGCRRRRSQGDTAPAHFPLANLSQEQLRSVSVDASPNGVYPLTPAQQGMLFHSVLSPGEGMYVNQTSFRIEGAFDSGAFRDALAILARRHDVLRTSIRWRGVHEPHQIVHLDSAASCQMVDLTMAEADGLANLLRDERLADFQLDRALHRAIIVRLDDRHHQLVWTNHHVALDGWSNSLLYSEWWDIYDGLVGSGRSRFNEPPAAQFREYVKWIGTQNDWSSTNFWQELLSGSSSAGLRIEPMLARDSGSVQSVIYRKATATLSRAIRRFCVAHRLTLGTLICGAWALVLSKETRERDVLFGVVTSGRSVPVMDIDKMAGTFSNTLPIRIQLPHMVDGVAYLRDVQAILNGIRKYDYWSLMDVQRISDLPSRSSVPFQSTVGVQNFPIYSGGEVGPLTVRRVGGGFMRNHYPCTITAYPGNELELRLRIDGAKVTTSIAERMADDMISTVARLVANELVLS